MKIIIAVLFIFIISTSNAQKVSEDSLKEIFYEGFDYLHQDVPELAIPLISKFILYDTTCYKVYFIRAYCYLRVSEIDEVDSNLNVKNNSNQTLLIEKAILDLRKSIQLYFLNPKSFPENSVEFNEEYVIPDSTIVKLEERRFSNLNSNIIDGVLVYITSKGKNKKLACECWKKVADEGISSIEILINEFCK